MDGVFIPRRVAVLGCGVIGGSLALALHEDGAAVSVFDPDVQQQDAMRAAGLTVAATAREAVAGAQWVVIATPVDRIVPLAAKVASAMPVGAVLSDVASVKAGLVAELDELARRHDVRLVSTHPLAGSALSGFAHARADLLEGATWVLTHHRQVDLGAQRDVTAALERIGARRVVELSAADHDAVLAVTSHLPQVVCSVLAATVGRLVTPEELALSGGGLRDTTRIADSNLAMWLPILAANADRVHDALEDVICELQAVQAGLREDPRSVLAEVFARAHQMRSSLPK